MSSTPRSSSPLKRDVDGDQSMMVEPPTHLEEHTQPLEDETVRLYSQPESHVRSQAPKGEQSQDMRIARIQEPQRQSHTPEPQKRRSNRPEVQSPGHLAPFDWDDFEDRYEKALQEADEQERETLEDFDRLVKYFTVWASASSNHDNERAVKRLQTRERYVRLHEQSLSQKKKHLSEVVAAFQSALALLKAA